MATPETYRYSVYGLTLLSEIPLRLPAAVGSEIIVELARGETADFQAAREGVPPEPDEWIQFTLLDDGNMQLRWGNFFEILVPLDGRRVLCRNTGDVPIESFEAYLTNFAVSAALIRQGEEPLHASVVEIGGRAIGLLGPSGAGKSTLAAFLISRGGTLITDDMLRVTFAGEVAFAQPGPHRIKLFREPAGRFLPHGLQMGYWSLSGEKPIFEPVGLTVEASPRPLAALYHLAAPSAGSHKPRLERLSGVDLFKTILSSSMDTRLHLPAKLERQFRFAERIALGTPVFRLTYPRSFDMFDEVFQLIYGSASN